MNATLRKVCRHNLLKTVERLKEHADPLVVSSATMIEGFFLDYVTMETPESLCGLTGEERQDADGTDYERYKLLRAFGLSSEQLVEVAKSDGLHELRIVRMLRLTYELSLEEALALLGSAKTGN